MPSKINILDLPLESNDVKASNIREYLIALLSMVWSDAEEFSEKRPFGGWQWEIYGALIKANLVAGKIDEDGDILSVDENAACKLMLEAIAELGKR